MSQQLVATTGDFFIVTMFCRIVCFSMRIEDIGPKIVIFSK